MGAFVLAIVLVTTAAIGLRIYALDLASLDAAMTREVSRFVRVAQEPLDTVRQVGLVSAALAKLNDSPQTAEEASPGIRPQPGWACAAEDQACQALHYLMEEVPRLMAQMKLSPPPAPTIPTAARSCLPPSERQWTYVMMPRQLAPKNLSDATSRVVSAVQLSSALDVALEQAKSKFAIERTDRAVRSDSRLVQAYFISPDSVLRIWTKAPIEDCESAFPQTRLWAAKAYFDEIWKSPTSYTRVYLDYGGNGLVKTYCSRLSVPVSSDEARGLEVLGALCGDYRIDFEQNRAALMDHLFFQTALVSIDARTPPSGAVVVDDRQPDSVASAWGDADPRVGAEEIRSAVLTKLAQLDLRSEWSSGVSDSTSSARPRDPGAGARARMRRDISTIQIRGRDAFMLPLGGTDSFSDYLLFVPRSPRLPWWDRVAGVLGLLLGGAACASAVYGGQLANSASQSRKRLDLLRNLQVGVVQVDRGDHIIAANDRAEEIFGRTLPKFADRQTGPSVNFARLIEPGVWRLPKDEDGDLERSSLEQENAARAAGNFSAYFAQLRGKSSRWIRVSATPMLLTNGGTTGDQARVDTVFASVDEVPDLLRLDLERRGPV